MLYLFSNSRAQNVNFNLSCLSPISDKLVAAAKMFLKLLNLVMPIAQESMLVLWTYLCLFGISGGVFSSFSSFLSRNGSIAVTYHFLFFHILF